MAKLTAAFIPVGHMGWLHLTFFTFSLWQVGKNEVSERLRGPFHRNMTFYLL